MKKLSRHNIFSKIRNSDKYYLLNVLSGHADILDSRQAELFKAGIIENESEWIEKGYLVEEADEASLYRQKYLNFLDDREQDEIQLFYVPSYACNFTCSYCYQDEYEPLAGQDQYQVLNALFEYISRNFAGRRKYITLFGGEPLMTGPGRKELVRYFLNTATANQVPVSIVTNGYTLAEYLPLLKEASIKEIQVTLDGPEKIHDQRRYLKNKAGTFDRIVQGIDQLLENRIHVNLRVVLDQENIAHLPALAKYAIDKNWTTSPYFKTQLGRNYELHHCQTNHQRLFTRIGLYEAIYLLLQKHPELTEFHRPSFSISKFLFENGELPQPLFDSCPGTKTEWAFDYTGQIYACTATVGKTGESIGTFYPEITLDKQQVDSWQERDVLGISACQECSQQLACGGGCAAVAKNQYGSINSPDCRPVSELLELGIGHYFKAEL